MNAVERAELTRLVARAADGDRRALEPLFVRAWPAVRGFCARVVGPTDADDVAQETLIRVFAQLTAYDRERDALTWMFTIAAWQCRTATRRHHRRGELPITAAAAVASGGAPPDELAGRRELLAAAAAVLGTLSPTDASTLVAAWSDDDHARAALAPATFRKRLARALARFRAGWRSRHGVP